jgi:hypothetical protein
MNSPIEPECRKQCHPFIEVNGLFLPCCYIATHSRHEQELRDFFGDDYEMLKLQNNHPKKIMKLWNKIFYSWKSKNPYVGCLRHCPKGGHKKIKGKE